MLLGKFLRYTFGKCLANVGKCFYETFGWKTLAKCEILSQNVCQSFAKKTFAKCLLNVYMANIC